MNTDSTPAPANDHSHPPQTRDRAADPVAASAFLDGPVNILIVDDEPKNLTVLETVLDDPGYRLVRAESPDQALLALVVEDFALLILDIRMPGMTGFELAQMIKNRKKTAQVPIIFLTAYYNEDQHVLAGYGTGAVDYLHKPVNAAILRSKVAVFVELHRKNRESALANRALLAEVTERRRAEERLRELNESLDRSVIERSEALFESEERYRTLFNSMDEGFCIVEVLFDESQNPVDFRFLEINPAFEKQTGLKDALNRRMRELVPEHEQDWFDVFGKIALGGEPARFENRAAALGRWYEIYAFRVGKPASRHIGIVFNDITERKRAAEGLIASEQRLRAIYDGTHEFMGLLTPDGTDITERKDAEEALKEADRRKDEFLAMLAHELRNPLAAISNASKVLQIKDSEAHDWQWGRDIIDRQARQLTRLIDDLLDVSRITRGKVRLKRQPLDVRDVIRRTIESVQTIIDSKKHELRTSLPDIPLPADADPARLEQVFGNLLTNAAKYTDEGGCITLSATREDAEILVSVRDTGVGIAAEPLAQIFSLFTQVDTSLDRSQGGLGIGLTLVKALVEMHGGNVSASSEGPGKGSKFTVRLPVFIQADKPDTGVRPDNPPTTGRPCQTLMGRVLVVDDNVDTAEGMARLLKASGYQPSIAHSGAEALEIAREVRPDFALLDIGLPGMNGYEVAQTLREDERLRDAILIAISGYGQEQDRIRSRTAGFDHHLVKPVDFDSLLLLLERLQRSTSAPSR